MTSSSPAPVRVRFAPSPTGSLHVGGARIALFAWLMAKGQAPREGRSGQFLLRIEDTDRNRLVPGATEGILEMLAWFGLSWDEGPDVGGPVGPYVQSERRVIYRDHAGQLIASGHAYRCFCTPERLQAVREAQQARKEPPGYDRHCRDLAPEVIQASVEMGIPSVVRFAMPLTGETRFNDLLRGEIVYQNETLEDLVILKSDGYPTYHLAHMVDDHLMGITHVTRGPEWIPSTPLHVNLYRAFGWEIPVLVHMPLILAPGGGKLSKRHGSTSLEEFRAQGYLPEALMNYSVLLGWSYDATTEIFSRDDLREKFDLARVSAAPATFDYQKLTWFNQYYINHILDLDDLTTRLVPFLAEAGLVDAGATDPAHADFQRLRPAVALLKDRLETLAEGPDLLSYFLLDELPPYDPALLVPKKVDPALVRLGLEAAVAAMAAVDLDDEVATEAHFRALADGLGLKAGQLFMPIRVAVTGRAQSPGLFETLRVIGAGRVERRLGQAVALVPDDAVMANAG